MLANNLADHTVTDFQQYPSWRPLVPVVADEIVRVTGQELVAAQSLLVEDYWCDISTGLTDSGARSSTWCWTRMPTLCTPASTPTWTSPSASGPGVG